MHTGFYYYYYSYPSEGTLRVCSDPDNSVWLVLKP